METCTCCSQHFRRIPTVNTVPGAAIPRLSLLCPLNQSVSVGYAFTTPDPSANLSV